MNAHGISPSGIGRGHAAQRLHAHRILPPADLTEKAFHDGWYLTGDLGYLADGEVYITGRKKDLIIVGGKNVYPQDLEALASEVPGIHPGRVVAFGVFNEEMGTEEVVIVAEDEDPAADREILSNEIRRGSPAARISRCGR